MTYALISVLQDCLVPLTQGKMANVSPEDFGRVLKHNWHYSNSGYAVRNIRKEKGQTLQMMHRIILNCPAEFMVDHINGDKLDNRRQNLRIAGKYENQWNRQKLVTNKSGYKGVSYKKNKVKNPWVAQINHMGRKIHIGYYACPEIAYKAYKAAALQLHGEFARFEDWSN